VSSLLGHTLRHRQPEVTSESTSTFPSVRIHNLKRAGETRLHVLNVEPIDTSRRVHTHRSPSRGVEVQHIRLRKRKLRPVRRSIAGGGIARAVTVRHEVGDGWVVVDDEVAPDLHEGELEVGAQVCWCWAEVPGDVGAVGRWWRGELVLVACMVLAALGLGAGEPVGGTHEGGLRVNVVGDLENINQSRYLPVTKQPSLLRGVPAAVHWQDRTGSRL